MNNYLMGDYNYDSVDFNSLCGKTLRSAVVNKDSHKIEFVCTDDSIFIMMHYQECCEYVYLEHYDDLTQVVGSPIILAEAVTNYDAAPPEQETYGDPYRCWAFYKLVTAVDFVTLRWYGESNGYYSVEAQLYKVTQLHE